MTTKGAFVSWGACYLPTKNNEHSERFKALWNWSIFTVWCRLIWQVKYAWLHKEW